MLHNIVFFNFIFYYLSYNNRLSILNLKNTYNTIPTYRCLFSIIVFIGLDLCIGISHSNIICTCKRTYVYIIIFMNGFNFMLQWYKLWIIILHMITWSHEGTILVYAILYWRWFEWFLLDAILIVYQRFL